MSGLDSFFSGMRSASTALAAERIRIDIIADNIANAQTTRTPEGGAYRRRVVHFAPVLRKLEDGSIETRGVRVTGIFPDNKTPMQTVYDPSHPDANEFGMVELPNVNTVSEMASLITAMRSYEANLSVQQTFSRMAERALELAR